jgi:hypothetical protein
MRKLNWREALIFVVALALGVLLIGLATAFFGTL